MVVPVHVAFAAERAHAVIEKETCHSVNLETGGLLVGRLVNYSDKPILAVVAATGPGPSADRRPLYYGSDQLYLQRELKALRDEFSEFGVDYVGEWHKHPPDIPRLSYGDISQARQILADPDYRLQGGLLMPLTLLRQGHFELRCFYLSSELPQPVEIPSSDGVQDTALRTLLEETLCSGCSSETIPDASAVHSVFYEEILQSQERKPTRLNRDIERVQTLEMQYGFKTKNVAASDECVELQFANKPLYLKDWPDLLPRNKRAYLDYVSVKFVRGYPKDPVIKVKVSGRLYAVNVTRDGLRDNAPLDHLLEAFFDFLLNERKQVADDFKLIPTAY